MSKLIIGLVVLIIISGCGIKEEWIEDIHFKKVEDVVDSKNSILDWSCKWNPFDSESCDWKYVVGDAKEKDIEIYRGIYRVRRERPDGYITPERSGDK